MESWIGHHFPFRRVALFPGASPWFSITSLNELTKRQIERAPFLARHAQIYSPEPPLTSGLSGTFPWENFSLSWLTEAKGTNKVQSLWVDPGEFLVGRSPLIHTLVCPQRFRLSPLAVGTGLQKAGPVRACTGIHALLWETGLRLSSAVPRICSATPHPHSFFSLPFTHSPLGQERVTGFRFWFYEKQGTKTKLCLSFSTSRSQKRQNRCGVCLPARNQKEIPPLCSVSHPSAFRFHTQASSLFYPVAARWRVWCLVPLLKISCWFYFLIGWWGLMELSI